MTQPTADFYLACMYCVAFVLLVKHMYNTRS